MAILVFAARDNWRHFSDCVGFCYSVHQMAHFDRKIEDLTRAVNTWQMKERAEGVLNLIVQPSYFGVRLAASIVVLAERYFVMTVITIGTIYSEDCRKQFLPSLARLVITQGKLDIGFKSFEGYHHIALAVLGSLVQIISPKHGMKILRENHHINFVLDSAEMQCYAFKFRQTEETRAQLRECDKLLKAWTNFATGTKDIEQVRKELSAVDFKGGLYSLAYNFFKTELAKVHHLEHHYLS